MSDRSKQALSSIAKYAMALLFAIAVLVVAIWPQRPLFGTPVKGSLGYEFRPYPPVFDNRGTCAFFDLERNVLAVFYTPLEFANIGLHEMIRWNSGKTTIFPDTVCSTELLDCQDSLIIIAHNKAKLELNLKAGDVRNWIERHDLFRHARNSKEEGGVGMLAALETVLAPESRQLFRAFRQANGD